MTGDKFDFTNVNTVIDLLYKFTAQQWQTFIGAFPAAGEAAVEGGVNAVQAIEKMQNFFGLNIAYTPWQVITNFFSGGTGTITMVIAAIAIPVLAGVEGVGETGSVFVGDSQSRWKKIQLLI